MKDGHSEIVRHTITQQFFFKKMSNEKKEAIHIYTLKINFHQTKLIDW